MAQMMQLLVCNSSSSNHRTGHGYWQSWYAAGWR
jgi:hypothetical protein